MMTHLSKIDSSIPAYLIERSFSGTTKTPRHQGGTGFLCCSHRINHSSAISSESSWCLGALVVQSAAHASFSVLPRIQNQIVRIPRHRLGLGPGAPTQQ